MTPMLKHVIDIPHILHHNKMEISRIGIIAHPEVKKEFVQKIVKKLRKKDIHLYFDPIAAGKIKEKKTNVGDMRVDLAIILGGDGTLLWSVNELKSNPIILGINTGRVGYLAELKAENAIKGIEKLLRGEFFIEERMKLIANNRYEALNELAILPKRPASLLEFRINLDQEKIAEFRADGVLVSTQTGSTGHSLSLGGPIIHPEARVYLISPMVPFMREQAPLIVPDSSKTEIALLRKNRDAYLVLDGNIVKIIKSQSKVSIEKSKNKVKFVRFPKNKKKGDVDTNRKV
ncbi:MAG: hypothetical protein DRO76_01815 [Candidatus Altiarchaeales archaeon]|nr:MAG: hypothetical protein DRO76_01815 [Candidatus Altiarchaeales archaeon]